MGNLMEKCSCKSWQRFELSALNDDARRSWVPETFGLIRRQEIRAHCLRDSNLADLFRESANEIGNGLPMIEDVALGRTQFVRSDKFKLEALFPFRLVHGKVSDG